MNVVKHPDYAKDYERAFCQEPPDSNASAEYVAGYGAAKTFVDALLAVGMHKVPGSFVLSTMIGPMGHIADKDA